MTDSEGSEEESEEEVIGPDGVKIRRKKKKTKKGDTFYHLEYYEIHKSIRALIGQFK